jgi:uncharacterized protein
VIAHVILGFPGETKEMMKDTVRHVAALPVSGIKLQLLHVLRGTALAEQYQLHPFPMMELDEYSDFVIDCLELLPPDMVVHRLTGDGPRSLLLAPSWSTDKKTHFKHHSSPSQRTQYQTRRTFLWLNHLQSINLRSYIC